MAERRKVAIVGAGKVGASIASHLVAHRTVDELVLIDRKRRLALGVACDMRYGAAVDAGARQRRRQPPVVVAGEAADLAGCAVVVVTAGLNEKAGNATDPRDPLGRLRLARPNRGVYVEWAPEVARRAPDAVFIAVTDPPDPLADLAKSLCPALEVISSGTYIDSLRFRYHIAEACSEPLRRMKRREVLADEVDGVVIGEHGRSAVQVWSGVRVRGVPLARFAARHAIDLERLAPKVREQVALANIHIIRGTGASQYGIGAAVARIVAAILDDERCVLPVGSRKNDHHVTLSLPTVVGRRGALKVSMPRSMTPADEAGLAASAELIRRFARKIGARSPRR